MGTAIPKPILFGGSPLSRGPSISGAEDQRVPPGRPGHTRDCTYAEWKQGTHTTPGAQHTASGPLQNQKKPRRLRSRPVYGAGKKSWFSFFVFRTNAVPDIFTNTFLARVAGGQSGLDISLELYLKGDRLSSKEISTITQCMSFKAWIL